MSRSSRAPVDRSPDPPAPDDDACLEWLWRTRFAADGRRAVCPQCERPTRFYRLRGRRAYSCELCGRQLYPTADTPFSGTSTPLSVWFRAAHELGQGPRPVSGRELARRLDLDYRAALRIRSRLLTASSEPRTARLLEAAGHWYAAGGTPVSGASVASGEVEHPAVRQDPPVDAILQAAVRLIAQHGLRDMRLEDVAREAGTSNAAVRRVFRTKEALLLASFTWAEERLLARVEALMAAEDDPLRRLRGLLELTLASPGPLRDQYRLWLEVWVSVRERVHEFDEADVFYSGHDALLETIRQGRAMGVFMPVASAETIAEAMIALGDGLGYKLAEGYWEITLTRSRELLHLFCEQMLGLTPGTLAEQA
jgi:AcrR family transcriptional regulator/transposase-like protein